MYIYVIFWVTDYRSVSQIFKLDQKSINIDQIGLFFRLWNV